MKIHVDDKLKMSELQEQFNSVFPFLRIEFFKTTHGYGEASRKEDMLPSTETLAKWRTKHNEGDLQISGKMTVEEVESGFQTKFGLCVQVFRKSRKVWLLTSSTDGWTLDEQNKHGSDKEQEVGE